MPRILHVHFKAKHNVGDAAVVAAVRELTASVVPGRISWSSLLVRALREPASDRQLRFIDSHDLVVIGGGGFCSKYALPLNDALIAKIKPPIVLFGVGHNRHLGEAGLDEQQLASLRLLAQKAALCGVRDRLTQGLLGLLGVETLLTGDPALFLRPRRPWRVPPRRPPAIGINVACHGWSRQQELLAHVLDLYRAVIAGLSARRSPQLLYMVHTDREVPVARELRREFRALRVCRYPPAQLLYLYGRLDLTVSMMLHASILACAAGTPVVNVAYDEKNRAFMEDTGHPGRCFPVGEASADAVLGACEGLLSAGPPREPGLARTLYGDAMDSFLARLAVLASARA
jgi:polysaccharide pyruvyl transferase WcaK-like protein